MCTLENPMQLRKMFSFAHALLMTSRRTWHLKTFNLKNAQALVFITLFKNLVAFHGFLNQVSTSWLGPSDYFLMSHLRFLQLPYRIMSPETKWLTYRNHILTNEPWPIKSSHPGKPSFSTFLRPSISHQNTSKTHQAIYHSVFFPTHIIQCNLSFLSTQSTDFCHHIPAPGWWCLKLLFISFSFCSFFLAPRCMSWLGLSLDSWVLGPFSKNKAKKEGLVQIV